MIKLFKSVCLQLECTFVHGKIIEVAVSALRSWLFERSLLHVLSVFNIEAVS